MNVSCLFSNVSLQHGFTMPLTELASRFSSLVDCFSVVAYCIYLLNFINLSPCCRCGERGSAHEVSVISHWHCAMSHNWNNATQVSPSAATKLILQSLMYLSYENVASLRYRTNFQRHPLSFISSFGSVSSDRYNKMILLWSLSAIAL